MKPLQLIDTDTGQVVDHWKLIWTDDRVDESTARMRVFAKGKTVDVENVSLYNESTPDDSPVDHGASSDSGAVGDKLTTDDEFGETIPLGKAEKFTKVCQTRKPAFTIDTYRGYWMEICYAIQMNTGIIARREANGSIHPLHTIDDWMQLLTVSRSTASAFVNECKAEGYLAPIVYRGRTFWIVNPHFMWNGNTIPKPFWELFTQMDASL
jgi:hypothetical protein